MLYFLAWISPPWPCFKNYSMIVFNLCSLVEADEGDTQAFGGIVFSWSALDRMAWPLFQTISTLTRQSRDLPKLQSSSTSSWGVLFGTELRGWGVVTDTLAFFIWELCGSIWTEGLYPAKILGSRLKLFTALPAWVLGLSYKDNWAIRVNVMEEISFTSHTFTIRVCVVAQYVYHADFLLDPTHCRDPIWAHKDCC